MIFAYDTNNRLVLFNSSTVTYDADGNMLSNGALSCTYDSANRLISAGGHTYTYNAEDVRIRNLCEDEDTTYTYNTNAKLSQLLMKTTNGVVTKYVYGRGLIGEETNNVFKTYHFDCRGSTIAITDASGTVTDTFAYDTYGKLISRTGTGEVIFGYNGRDGVVTDANGLVYMRARYYSPDMRRFINADIVAGAISNAVTLNRFAYANGDPVSLVDPFGLAPDNRWSDSKKFWKKHYPIYGFADTVAKSLWLMYGGVHFEERTIDGVQKIIIYGKRIVRNSSDVDIPQTIINADNISKYKNIGKYLDTKVALKDAFSSYADVMKGTAKASDYLGVAGDVFGIFLETAYHVSEYDDPEDRMKVGIYTVATGTVEAVASTAAAAVVTPLATAATTAIATKLGSAVGTAIAPGIGTAVGFLVGLGVGCLIGALSDVGRNALMDS